MSIDADKGRSLKRSLSRRGGSAVILVKRPSTSARISLAFLDERKRQITSDLRAGCREGGALSQWFGCRTLRRLAGEINTSSLRQAFKHRCLELYRDSAWPAPTIAVSRI